MTHHGKTLALYLIPALLTLPGCRPQPARPQAAVPIRNLRLQQSREAFEPFGVLGGMALGMTCADGFLYVGDHDNDRILKIDPTLEAVAQIGTSGQGPGELSWPGLPYLADGRLSVYSSRNQAVVTYDADGRFLTSTPIHTIRARFVVHEDTVYASWPVKEHAVTATDLSGREVRRFGALQLQDAPQRHRWARNGRHLGLVTRAGRPLLIAVCEAQPALELYDLAGTLITRQDLHDNPFLTEQIARSEAFYQTVENRDATAILFNDAIVADDALLVQVYASKPPYPILRFTVTDNAFHHTETWRIYDAVQIQAIAYDPGAGLFLYDGRSNEIGRYGFAEADLSR